MGKYLSAEHITQHANVKTVSLAYSYSCRLNLTLNYDAQRNKKTFMHFMDNPGPEQPTRMRRLSWAFFVSLQNQLIL